MASDRCRLLSDVCEDAPRSRERHIAVCGMNERKNKKCNNWGKQQQQQQQQQQRLDLLGLQLGLGLLVDSCGTRLAPSARPVTAAPALHSTHETLAPA